MNAAAMIDACFRAQHPEAFDRPEVPEPLLPKTLRYGDDITDIHWPQITLPEEPVGDPDARRAAL